MQVQDVHDLSIETDATHVVAENVNEVVQPDASVFHEVTATDPVPFAIIDTKVKTPASTKLTMHTDEAFPRGLIDRSMLTKYVDHVAY